jgi:hypothetical protein
MVTLARQTKPELELQFFTPDKTKGFWSLFMAIPLNQKLLEITSKKGL